MVRALFDDPDPDRAGRMLGGEDGLVQLFHAESYWSMEVDFAARRGMILESQPDWVRQRTPAGFVLPDAILIEHPFYQHFARPNTFLPATASGIWTARAWRASASRSQIQELLGTPHQLVVPLRRDPQLGGLVMMRSGQDFSDRDRALAIRLQPLLIATDRHLAELSRWRSAADRADPVDGAAPAQVADDFGLTPRELVVLQAMADGLTTTSVAARLHVSPRAVRRHQESLHRKLGTSDRVSTVLRAERIGLLGRADAADEPPFPRGVQYPHPPPVSGAATVVDFGRCRVCQGPVARASTGRPRAFCGSACRQRAYRERRR
ncbi:helix-turn-helix transcriptional regulator [Pseudonocardia sp. GCM10023141]|uniref:helix-turn-helix transcriptional regulator n=1 Tax=Pseudonocardia sp. GCM10023141 TaxID=3252653 RepID=UPI003623B630